jgi:hypothetical protein
MFWTILATLLVLWLIIIFAPSLIALLAWIALSVLDSPALHKLAAAGHKISAFLGKLFPAYTPRA